MIWRKVSVERRFRRSIRVDADQQDAAEGFVWTATARRAIGVLGEHVTGLGHSAFTWTGTYGCGKSSLAAILAASLNADARNRRKMLETMPDDVADNLKRTFWKRAAEWAVVPVIGRREAADLAVGRACRAVLGASAGPLLGQLDRRATEGRGTVVIIDEMGKLLEHAASSGSDVHFLQELAETANRSEGLLVVIGILHQAFDEYSLRMASDARDEWLKIQGRFVDVHLSPSGWEQVGLLSKAIVSEEAPDTLPQAKVVASAMLGSRAGSDTLAAELAACSPINPVTAALLGPLSKRRFGQNQRSIFGFLGSAEPSGFQDFLAHPERELYEPSILWSYLRSNLEPSILASPDGHRWSLAIDALERAEAHAVSDLSLRTLKTIALVDMFRERSGMVASEAVIAAALPDASAPDIEASLRVLTGLSVIVRRKHLGGYSLYAGSDFDIEAALDAAKRELGSCDFSRLKRAGVLAPILAKRHYHETGTMRWFEVEIATSSEALAMQARDRSSGSTGVFLLVVDDEGLSRAGLRSRMIRIAEKLSGSPYVVGVTANSYMLREVAFELAALEQVQSSSISLKGDIVARREISSRIARSIVDLEERVREALAAAKWSVPMLPNLDVSRQSGTSAADLARMASLVADGLFPLAPRLPSELLNRSKPSSNAMAALRALMTAMVMRPDAANLGIKDYPAEMGLYISLLQRTGIHDAEREGAPFAAPEPDDRARLFAIWTTADDLLRNAGSEGLTLEAIQNHWASRPYGVKAGLLPLLSLGYLLSRLRSTSVYLDETFCSSVNDLLVDRMLQEPAAVRVRESIVSADQTSLLRSVGALLSEIDGSPGPTSTEPLDLARRLVGFVMDLPPWVRRTSRLHDVAKSVRDLASAANDPNRFMLDDLPAVLKSDPDGTVSALRRGLGELAVAYGDLLASLSGTMLEELRVGPGQEELEYLRERARTVVGITGDFRLDAFATRLSTFNGTQAALEGILSLAANRPPRDWTDRDVDAVRTELASLCQDFLRAEGFAHVHGRVSTRTRMALFISDPGRPSLSRFEISLDKKQHAKVKAMVAKLEAALDPKLDFQSALAVVAELGARLIESEGAEGDSTKRIRGAA
jgi:hypothetical protein